MARGLAKRGKMAAFGDGHRIIWDHHSELIFLNNPNIARPGQEMARNVIWFRFYRGHRLYNTHDKKNDRWIWNRGFRAKPGEMFFSGDEIAFAERAGAGFVVIEPNVPEFKTVAPNKQWPVKRYQQVAWQLKAQGRDVVQFAYGGKAVIDGARQVKTPSFRHALAVLARASLYIGPEGGLHHGAAAVGVPAVVLFGGFIPPAVTGYDSHVNLTGGAEACGLMKPCEHCRQAMARISCEEVLEAAGAKLREDA